MPSPGDFTSIKMINNSDCMGWLGEVVHLSDPDVWCVVDVHKTEPKGDVGVICKRQVVTWVGFA